MRKTINILEPYLQTALDQIESPSKIGETQLHALNLDWKRFVTHQTADFIHHDCRVERGWPHFDNRKSDAYFEVWITLKLQKRLTWFPWDTYPTWHKEAVIDTAYITERAMI